MPRDSPITMTLPPFVGIVRQLVLANVAVFFAVAVLQWLAPDFADLLLRHLLLQPSAVAHGELWQLVTYSFLNLGIAGILSAMLTLWFWGSLLEGAYGRRWFAELYFLSAIGGALIASAISFTGVLSLRTDDIGLGAWASLMGVMVAIAVRMGDQEFLMFFVVGVRAKYITAIYLLVTLAVLLKYKDAFGALLVLSGALCGYLYVQFAPRRGMAFGFSEQFFGLRNAYYRSKRRRAARKFEVYMGKQGRTVNFDKEGRYVDPDEKKDPNDKRWMN